MTTTSKHDRFAEQQAEARRKMVGGATAESVGYWPAGPGFAECGCPEGQPCPTEAPVITTSRMTIGCQHCEWSTPVTGDDEADMDELLFHDCAAR